MDSLQIVSGIVDDIKLKLTDQEYLTLMDSLGAVHKEYQAAAQGLADYLVSKHRAEVAKLKVDVENAETRGARAGFDAGLRVKIYSGDNGIIECDDV